VYKTSDWVNQKFYSEDGAAPIKTLKKLEEALVALFWHRVDWNLEVAALADIMPFPDISSCSKVT